MSKFETEEGRLEAAKEAGRNVARHEIKDGYDEPRNWDRDGAHNAGAFSHLSAVGFSRLGSRMYSQTFIDAYRQEFEALRKDVPEISAEDALATLEGMLAAEIRNADALSYKLAKEREEYKNNPADDTKAIRDMTEIRYTKSALRRQALNFAIQQIR